MAHSWSRLHEHLGSSPGPVTFAMVRRCADEGLTEDDDLDWKECLPNGHDPQKIAEFAKDVAAMANTRGGLIIYGVADKPVKFTGITASDANPDQYAKWVRNLIQPYLAGLEQSVLTSDDGSEAVFVVDVPSSELAPHAVAFDHTRDQAKDQFASVTPYRSGSHTEWMAEHQIARAYAERLTRAADWQAEFDNLRDWTADYLLIDDARPVAWLIIVGRPTRPLPHSAPRLTADGAKALVDDACRSPVVEFQSRTPVLAILAAGYGHVTVDLNARIITNRVREGEQRMREVRVALQHDGGFVLAVNLSQHTMPSDALQANVINGDVIEQACADLEALLLQLLRSERIDTPMRLQASITGKQGYLLRCAVHDFSGYTFPLGAQLLPRVRPVTVEVPAGATTEQTQPAAAELASGLLNQFGLGCRLQRYIG